nr:hypothetical protein [Tanacetum cinerariifolium]
GFHEEKERDVAILKTKRWNFGACKQLVGEGVPGLMTHLITSLTPDSANSCVMHGASYTQRKVSMVLFVLPHVLLLVVIVVTIVIVMVISVVVVVAIVGVVVVVVGSNVSYINKLSLVIIDPTDEDGDIRIGDQTGVSVPSGGEISSRGKKSRESNIGGVDKTSMSKRYLVKSFEESGEMLVGEAEK